MAQGTPALLQVALTATLAAEQVDEPQATDEDDEPAQCHGDPAVVDLGRPLDEHAGHEQQDAQQPGALPEDAGAGSRPRSR